MHGHEGPVDKAVLGEIAFTLGQEHGVGAHGRAHVQVQVAASRVLNGHEQLNVLQVSDVIVLLVHTASRFHVDLDRIACAQVTICRQQKCLYSHYIYSR